MLVVILGVVRLLRVIIELFLSSSYIFPILIGIIYKVGLEIVATSIGVVS